MEEQIEIQRAFDAMRNGWEITLYLLVTNLMDEKAQRQFGTKLRGLADLIEEDGTCPPCDTFYMRHLADLLECSAPPPWIPKVFEGGKK
jgi:hypothetical protein